VTRNAKANLRNLARSTTATIALIAGGYLVISGSTAEPAAGESTNNPRKNETWIEKSYLAGPEADAKDDAQEQADIEDGKDGKRVAASKSSDNSRKNETWIEESFLAGPKSDAKDDAQAQDGKDVKSTAASKSSNKSRKEDKAIQNAFRPGPKYETKYDADEQLDIYGGKSAVDPPRPLLEIGREQYTSGLYDESSTLLGGLNPLLPGLAVYGDWRTAVAYNKNNGKDIAQIATRLHVDVDFKFTATERIHAFFTPIQQGNAKFTRFEFGGGGADDKFTGEFDPEPQTLFFEGDFGSLYSGFSGKEASFDLPFTVGLFPLFLQNGIWANDAILGGAVTLPAKNSAALGLSNFDVTFFAAFDNIDNASFVGADGKVDNDNANLFGVTTFIDAFNGYIEAGYGFLQGTGAQDGVEQHFLTAAYSRRYANTVSNSTRVFANFGDDGRGNGDGVAIISENSLISGLPSTLIPYANFFVGFGNPEPLVDGNNAGILKNVGINFETDALTGYPKLDDTASNTFGGALGIEYLFNLDQQLVFEVATVQPFENDGIGAKEAQYGFGVRYQIPIDRAWLFRADATYQILENGEDNFGIRTEIRRKF
jgi:hypothetical protein